jgi:hypothetical protein
MDSAALAGQLPVNWLEEPFLATAGYLQATSRLLCDWMYLLND